MAYATTTLGRATVDLAARLADPGFVRWSQAELSGHLIEALRTWNALTGMFRDQGTFGTVAGQAFYDVATVLPLQCGYSVTDGDLVATIELALLEPVNLTVWQGTSQFTLPDLVSALQRRRDQFLYETGLVQSNQRRPVAPPPNGRIPIDQAVMTVRRAAWLDVNGLFTPLKRDDVWSFNHYSGGWPQQTGSPIAYSVTETPPLVLQVVPPPSDAGYLDTVVVTRGVLLDPSVGVLLGIPDDWTWVVKFGALADLLSKDGLANDAPRASYCEQRWQGGIALAKASSVVWGARIEDVPVPINAVAEADQFDAAWQSRQGNPEQVLLAGGNLVALTPVPDLPGVDSCYSVTLDVVRRAPVPASLTDYLQVGSELLDTLYDYAQHLSMFKEGMDGVQSTIPLLERFYRLAGVQLTLDTAQAPNLSSLTEQTQRDGQIVPRTQEPVA